MNKYYTNTNHKQKNMAGLLRRVAAFAVMLLISLFNLQAQKYIKPVATGTGTGASWDNALGAGALRAALNAGGTIYIAAGTYNVAAQFTSDAAQLPAGTTVIGGFPANATGTSIASYNPATNITRIDGQDKMIFYIFNGTYVIKGLVFDNADGAGAGGSAIRAQAGGAVYNWTIEDCIIKNTTQSGGGGGAVWLHGSYIPGSRIKVKNCIFDNNQALAGSYSGALMIDGVANTTGGPATSTNNGTDYVVENCSFSNNRVTAGGSGGAMQILSCTGINVINCTFCNNFANNDAGALLVSSVSKFVMSGCSFTGNSNQGQWSPACWILSCPESQVLNCTFTNNFSAAGALSNSAGGGLAIESATGHIVDGCKFYNNTVNNRGGGLQFSGGGNLTLKNSIFKGNRVLSSTNAFGGGAVYVTTGSTATIIFDNNQFDSNSLADNTANSGVGGGAIHVQGGNSPVATNCTFFNNTYNGSSNILRSDLSVSGSGTFTASNSRLQLTQPSYTSFYNVATGNTFSNTTNPNLPAAPVITCPAALTNPFTPTFNPDFGVTNVNVPLTGNVNTNDNPTPGSTYSNPPANPANPSSCAPVVAANGSYTFVCATPGVYTFYVPVCEPSPSTVCTPVPLQITVNDPGRNDNAPVANPDYATTKANTPVTVDVRANDRCQNGPACTLSTPTVVTAPLNGTFNPATGVYTPAPGYVGKDSLRYNVCDNQAVPKCTSAWAYFDVKPAGSPNITNAADDYKQTPFGVTATGNVKTNDSDPEGDAQTVAPQTTTVAGKGTLTLLADGSYTFVPVAGFSGPVDFVYTTCDNGTPSACDTATLHVLVTPKEPTFNPDFGVTNVNVPLTGNVNTNDNPAPGSTYGNPPANPSNPSNCAPVVAANGTYTFVCATPGVYTFYVPVCEPSPSTVCTPVPLQITVNDPGRNDNAPVANPDYATTKANTPVTVDVRANDRCQNGPACTLSTPTVVTAPLNGTFNPATGVYTPAPGYVGKDSLRYNVCDNQAVPKCTSAWAYFDVKPAGSPNITNAADDYKQTPFGVTATGNVKTNDSDPEGDAQTVAPQTTTVAGKGTLTLLADGSYTFVPVAGFSGPVDFVYTTCDNGTPSACDTATLHVLVMPALPTPDFTPTIDIDALSFAVSGASRDFVVNITEISNNPSSGQIVVRIFKASAFNITYNAAATSAGVFGSTPVNNSDWIITENAFSITCTLKPGVVLTGFNLSSIGFNISRKAGIPGNTSQNITATISNGSGGDTNNQNNQFTVTITAQ